MRQGDLTHPLPHPHANDEIAAVLGGIDDLRRNSQLRQELERERDKLIASLREQSTTDFLTGLPNRRAFFESAEAEMARARRHGFGLVMLVIDVDHFKQINDTLGHSAGDQALVAVADVLRRSLRQGDFAARLGGEEFVALLSHCTPEDGLGYAERLRTAIEGQPLHLGGESVSRYLTVSIGVADSCAHGHELDLLLAQADAAMYRAKRAGRNRSQLA
jgi:diguanylate cyclase (GGDEF)-like protein